ncbi:MAG: hypothetical protein N2316_07420 [Spirochaetes bacterium]|nr:hypothetical protein [Spirochaetota bacterium]
MKKEINLSIKLHFDEIVDYAIEIYKNNFKYLIGLMAVFYIPYFILVVFLSEKIHHAFDNLFISLNEPSSLKFPIESTIRDLFHWSGISFILFFLVTTFSQAAIIKGTACKIEGDNAPISTIAQLTIKKAFPLIATTLIAMIMMGIGLVFCIIPFFILAIYLIYTLQAIMLEDTWGFGAIGRSFTMVSGNFWATLFIPLVFYLSYFFISSIITYAIMLTPYIDMFKEIIQHQGQITQEYYSEFLSKNFLRFIFQIIATNLLYFFMIPLLYIALTIKYFNIRNLKEGTQLTHAIEKEKQSSI